MNRVCTIISFFFFKKEIKNKEEEFSFSFFGIRRCIAHKGERKQKKTWTAAASRFDDGILLTAFLSYLLYEELPRLRTAQHSTQVCREVAAWSCCCSWNYWSSGSLMSFSYPTSSFGWLLLLTFFLDIIYGTLYKEGGGFSTPILINYNIQQVQQ